MLSYVLARSTIILVEAKVPQHLINFFQSLTHGWCNTHDTHHTCTVEVLRVNVSSSFFLAHGDTRTNRYGTVILSICDASKGKCYVLPLFCATRRHDIVRVVARDRPISIELFISLMTATAKFIILPSLWSAASISLFCIQP